MNFAGKPKVARMKISEIYPTRKRFGLVNYARDIKELEKADRGRRWWMGRSVRFFGVHNERANVREKVVSTVWENVKVALEKNRRR